MFCVLGPRRKTPVELDNTIVSSVYDSISQQSAIDMPFIDADQSAISLSPKDLSQKSMESQPCEESYTSLYSNQISKGEINLSLALEDNRLTIEISDARCIQGAPNGLYFVQLQLCPDTSSDKSKCRTASVNMTSTGMKFNEKFTYELLDEDYKKRLILSMWNETAKAEKNNNSDDKKELVGCMSFGMRNMASKVSKKEVKGWYHLLNAEVGHRKHLAVPNNIRSEKTNTSNISSNSGSSMMIPSSLSKGNAIELVIPKSSSGFGFTVKGSCPVRVGRVKENSTSHEAGLRRGDIIIKLNNQSVQRSSAESVAKLVRQFRNEKLVLSIHRSKRVTIKEEKAKKIENDENTPPQSSRLAGHRIQNNLHKECNFSHERAFIKSWEQSLLSTTVESSTTTVQDPSVWNPELSMIACDLPDLPSMMSVTDSTRAHDESRNGMEYTSSGSDKSNDTMDSTTDYHFLTPRNRVLESSTEGHFLTPGSIRCNQTISDISMASSNMTMYEKMDPRLEAIVGLVECEERFVSQMQLAIEKYSRPLRASILKPEQHSIVFQNIEKLVSISQLHFSQLINQLSTAPESVDISSIYQPRLQILIDAYAAYTNGQDDAFSLLEHLCSESLPFIHFMKQLPGHNEDGALNLAEFLDRPLAHLDDLSEHLQHIVKLTPQNHPEFASLCDTVEALSIVRHSLTV